MIKLLIMCLLVVSGVFFETSASPIDTPQTEMMSVTNDVEGMATKSKRHNFHLVTPCPQPHSQSGSYLPPASLTGHYQKPFVIPSYHHTPKVKTIAYQKPTIPKMVYQTIRTPAIHHAAYNVQPITKPQVQYIQQPTYVPSVKEQTISYVKPAAPAVSYEHVQKSITNYVKPVQHIQPIQMIHPIKTYVKKIPCEHGPPPTPAIVVKPVEKPVHEMQSYYAKQFFQPVSYYPKPLIQPKPIPIVVPHVNKIHYPITKVLYQKPTLISHQRPTIKVLPASEPACEKIHQPDISYVKIQQPIGHNVHQPMFQYAPKYHQPAFVHRPMVHFQQKIHQPVVQQPLFHFTPKIHQPIAKNEVIHYTQPIVYGNAQHSVSAVAPQVDYHHGHNYQSPIISVNQPCHK